MNSSTSSGASPASQDEPTRHPHCCGAADEAFLRGLRRTRARADALREEMMCRARHAATDADEAVHHHPYRALGVAAAAALVVGFLLARR